MRTAARGGREPAEQARHAVQVVDAARIVEPERRLEVGLHAREAERRERARARADRRRAFGEARRERASSCLTSHWAGARAATSRARRRAEDADRQVCDCADRDAARERRVLHVGGRGACRRAASADAPNVATVEPHSAMTVLTSAVCASTVPAGSAPPTKLGQYSQRKVVPTSDSTSETVDERLLRRVRRRTEHVRAREPKYAPNMWMMIVPPQSTTSSPGRMDRAPCGRARA